MNTNINKQTQNSEEADAWIEAPPPSKKVKYVKAGKTAELAQDTEFHENYNSNITESGRERERERERKRDEK